MNAKQASNNLSRVVAVAVLAAAAFGGWRLWLANQASPLPEGIVSSNGRVEAVQVDVATKFAGRIREVLVREGDLVKSGQVLARMDTLQLEAQRDQANALLAETKQSVEQAKADIEKSKSDVALAQKQAVRAENLLARNAMSQEDYDTTVNSLAVANATLGASKAALRTQEYAVKAAEAQVHDIETQLTDSVLLSPTRGRVLYRLSEAGEVLGVGGKVITLIDLTDVYMQVYLPARAAVRTRIGSEARVVLDAIPQYAGRGKVSFVAPQAQFTPKEVETREERDKLMFRVKVQLPPEKAEPYIERIKTGVRGVAYIRIDPKAQWPEFLERPFPAVPPASFPLE